MMENTEKALDCSEKIELLVDLRFKYSNLPFTLYVSFLIQTYLLSNLSRSYISNSDIYSRKVS
ncbi:unnamed protein product [Arabidopsis halleri]